LAVQFRMSAMLQDEARKVLEGITIIEEVSRINRMQSIARPPPQEESNNLLTYPGK